MQDTIRLFSVFKTHPFSSTWPKYYSLFCHHDQSNLLLIDPAHALVARDGAPPTNCSAPPWHRPVADLGSAKLCANWLSGGTCVGAYTFIQQSLRFFLQPRCVKGHEMARVQRWCARGREVARMCVPFAKVSQRRPWARQTRLGSLLGEIPDPSA